ncbi:SGNH/GDSL hydrolase family protein [Nigerium massiliense]|uniref:hypothetical protein n=1 Tax=Nigerium massiliense TaxID=1522317 RepID=UPI00058B9D0B|nr:hypothetical protein [Nigerium massiliense]
MAFTWIAGDAVNPSYRSGEFPTQADAEAWLTESFDDLLEDGVEAVTLLDGDSVVYGPMSLRP